MPSLPVRELKVWRLNTPTPEQLEYPGGAPSMFAQGTSGSPATSQIPQQFSFASVATNVRFTNLSNFGEFTNPGANNRIGFSEIQFATEIPEPSSLLALLAFGLAGR